MTATAKLIIDLTPELREHLNYLSKEKQISPSNLAAEILRRSLKEEIGRAGPADDSSRRQVERRRQIRPVYNPEEVVADIQKSLEALNADFAIFDPDHPLAAEVEALIRQTELEREGGC